MTSQELKRRAAALSEKVLDLKSEAEVLFTDVMREMEEEERTEELENADDELYNVHSVLGQAWDSLDCVAKYKKD